MQNLNTFKKKQKKITQIYNPMQKYKDFLLENCALFDT